jgi:hypothetical protein
VDSIRNPADYLTPGAAFFKITTSNGGDVDRGEFNDWNDGRSMYKSSYIKTFSVKAGSYIAGRTPVTYYFTIVPFTKVAMDAIIVVDIPKELEISSSQQLSRACPSSDTSGFTFS